jgi:hypothetical protein
MSDKFYDINCLGEDNRILARFTSTALTGPLKLCQVFSAAFLTEKGSCPYAPDYGSAFMMTLKAGLIRTDPDVAAYFNQAATEVLYYLNQQDDQAELPDNERISEVLLDNFILEPPLLKLYITITTVSGERQSFELPVSVIGEQ